MMMITDAAAPISVQLIRTLNQHNFNYLVLADRPDCQVPEDLRFQQRLPADQLLVWIDEHQHELEFVFHLESTSAEATFRELWRRCAAHQIPFAFSSIEDRAAWIQQQSDAPFFWAGLLSSKTASSVEPTADPEQAQRLANACYYLIHHRTNPGFYSYSTEVPTLLNYQ